MRLNGSVSVCNGGSKHLSFVFEARAYSMFYGKVKYNHAFGLLYQAYEVYIECFSSEIT
jgi:hypothetical protein